MGNLLKQVRRFNWRIQPPVIWCDKANCPGAPVFDWPLPTNPRLVGALLCTAVNLIEAMALCTSEKTSQVFHAIDEEKVEVKEHWNSS